MDVKATAQTEARYDRIAPIYDLMEAFVEHLAFRHWRKKLWSLVDGEKVLEVGVGTGKNMPYYPNGAQITAIDLSDRMLQQARKRAERLELDVDLRQMDVQALDFPDGAFDAVVASFVFCSVPDPVLGLRELARVTKPGGQILLLEHVRARNAVLGKIMDILNPLVVRIGGANINRRTVKNVERAGLEIETVKHLLGEGVVKLIVASAPQENT
jgi:ubiquinone/menaquinone biosynthesis C-methylase UbiE